MAYLFLNEKRFAYAEICDSFLKKLLGLMFRKRLDKDKCLLFIFDNEKIISIHMFFVFFPIDAVWLDKNYRIVDFKLGLKPFSFFHCSQKKAKYLIEAAAGKCNEIKLGNIFRLEKQRFL